jgi:sporulation protein YlmC with PRC-barrel domain
MPVLSALTGLPVLASDGRPIGKLVDLTARPHDAQARVHRLLVRSRRRVVQLVPWDQAGILDTSCLKLRPPTEVPRSPISSYSSLELADDELLLVRDVLDTQIVDVHHHRVARVADVILRRTTGGELDAVAVEIGLSGVAARLGLGALSRRLPQRAIAWGDLHLTSERGHASQLATTTSAVHRLDSRALAELLTRLRVESAADIIQTVGTARSAQALARVHPSVGHSLLRAMPPEDVDRLMQAMPPDTAVRYRRLIAGEPLRGRRYLRTRGWRRHRPPPDDSTSARTATERA